MSLFNKYNFRLKDFTADSVARPELSGLFINTKEVVATDSFVMIKVSNVKGLDIDDYPAHPDGKKILKDFNSFILPREQIDDVLVLFKKDHNTLPILNSAVVLKSDKGQAEIGKTDLETFNSVNSKIIDAVYPSYKKLYNTQRNQKCITIKVNAKFLRKIANFYGNFCDDLNNEVEISVPIKRNGIIGFSAIRKETNQKAEAILMPIASNQ